MSDLEIVNQLQQHNPEALLLEPREVYDPALIGITDEPNDSWTRQSGIHVAVYDVDKCIEAIMGWMDCDYESALDWFGFNTSGGWVGEGTPTFRSCSEE